MKLSRVLLQKGNREREEQRSGDGSSSVENTRLRLTPVLKMVYVFQGHRFRIARRIRPHACARGSMIRTIENPERLT
jgi:hypothetical protein